MKQFDADTMEGLEPIVVKIDGKDYTVTKVTQKIMDEIQDLSRFVEDGGSKGAPRGLIAKQTATLLGTEPSEFMETDLRKLSAAAKFILRSIKGETEAGDAEGKKD